MRLSLGKTFNLETEDKKLHVPIQDYEAPEAPVIPAIPFDTSATVRIGDLQKSLNDFSKIYEHVWLVSRPLGGVLELKSGDDLEGQLNETVKTTAQNGNGSAIYPIHYLSKAVKGIPRDTVARLDWGNDIPLRISYLIEGPPNIEVMVIVAPRVEDDQRRPEPEQVPEPTSEQVPGPELETETEPEETPEPSLDQMGRVPPERPIS